MSLIEEELIGRVHDIEQACCDRMESIGSGAGI